MRERERKKKRDRERKKETDREEEMKKEISILRGGVNKWLRKALV